MLLQNVDEKLPDYKNVLTYAAFWNFTTVKIWNEESKNIHD
jgi:hypothetical protein